MRIKTSNKTLILLEEYKNLLEVDSNAKVLKLAINVCFASKCNKINKNIKEDGFEIDTLIIFGLENDYYQELIKEFYNINQEDITKVHYLNLIEYGMEYLQSYIQRAKNDKVELIKLLLEDI